ncbi:hypothetical protein B0H14DRAFT_2681152 [Mycena olivaceomarginata]|nr:hypothetical protein B0H14DRAFT_2681152 [Mycena olivaceomarginata]
MQLASHGVRVLTRKAPQTARSLHIPSARPQAAGLGQKLLTQTRLALTRFVGHLTAPGLGNTVSVARSFHAANPSIHQRLSFAARTTLARPVQSRFLPARALGLGTARNFSSGRPIFQQLADNIPVAGRAFYEADWEVNMHKERQALRRPASKRAAAVAQASKELLKPTAKPKVVVAAPETEAEIEHYFPAPALPAVTTTLLIPLAPTPTSRAPLPSSPLLLSPLEAQAASPSPRSSPCTPHTKRTPRACGPRGVTCAAYASTVAAGTEGVCNVLKVEFRGWSKAAVRGVLGESGTGWCVLEESVSPFDYDDYEGDEDAFSETSSVLSGMELEEPVQGMGMDPAQSFVLPTLDFSSSFLAATTPSTPAAPVFYDHANASADSVLVWSDPAFVDPPSSSENGWFASEGVDDPWLDSDSDSSDGSGWLGFSAAFSTRLTPAATPEPRESVFA